MKPQTSPSAGPVAHWLFACAGLVFAMIVIGAVTRLTESGLSMVEWRPLIGTLPPLSEAEWQRVFSLYRESPEYRKENFWMDLDDFKIIFFWEWFHRLMGRLIGVVYAVPLVFFWIRGMIPGGYKWPLLGLLVLGGLQGVLGWYMVKSGLVDRPDVSHYRLAAHLAMAFLILGLLVWNGLSLSGARGRKSTVMAVHGLIALALFVLTVFWGAFTAGLDAGLIYNETFPKMAGGWLPPDIWRLQPAWLNFFENHGGVQFAHRWLAVLTALTVISFWARGTFRQESFPALHMLGAMIVIQLALGILTLLSGVMLPLAVLHQAGAALVLILLVTCLHHYRGTH